MLEVLFGILGILGDILAPTPAVRSFWCAVLLMLVLAAIAYITKMPLA